MKYVLVILVVALVLWLLLRGRGRVHDSGKAHNPTNKPTQSATSAAPMDMVACARCGVHLPQGEALLDARGRTFCGYEHRDAGVP